MVGRLTKTCVALYFNIRTRSLNSLMFNVMQVVGAIFIGFMLDNSRISSRRARGFVSVAVVATIVIAGWIGLTVWLYKNPMDLLNPPLFDWTDGPFGGFFVLNLIFGMNMVIVSETTPLQQIAPMSTELSLCCVVPSHGAVDHLQLHQ